MTFTPIPSPLISENTIVIVCNNCLKYISVSEENEVPKNWIKIYLKGWVGAFHVCSIKCEKQFLLKNNKG